MSETVRPAIYAPPATHNAVVIPYTHVRGHRPHPFALLIPGSWKFDGARLRWSPRSTLVSLIGGVNGTTKGERQSDPVNAAAMQNAAIRSKTARFFTVGDPRLGKFSQFVVCYAVRSRKGKVYPHFALPSEVYGMDAHGRISRRTDYEWLDGLNAHLVTAGHVPPMSWGELEDQADVVRARIKANTQRALKEANRRPVLEERVEADKARLSAMLKAYAEQFPKGKEEWDSAAPSADHDDGASLDGMSDPDDLTDADRL